MDHISRRDRIILSLLCLTPIQRVRLERLRELRGPVQCSEIGGNLSALRRDLHKFRVAALVDRTGSRNSTRHCLYGDVAALMDGCRSIGKAGARMDPETGLSVLEAVRSIRAEHKAPWTAEVGRRAGIDVQTARRWMRRLKDAGLIDELPRYSSPGQWARNTAV
jgi:hypothetical protein